MNRIITFIASILLLFTLGCETENFLTDTTPPSPPTGLTLLSLDNQVNLDWNNSRETDVVGYNVYVSSSYAGRYVLIGSTHNIYFDDKEAVNGRTYYYAVTAYDESDNESDLSKDKVYATPRPEGFDVIITDYRTQPSTAGYDFSTKSILNYDHLSTDIFFENYNGTYYMDVWDNADIKDMGMTSSFDDITIAPMSGWSTTKDVLLAVGKTCVVWTYDDHYAKFRVVSLSPSRIVFDWSYQLQKGNPNLKRAVREGTFELKLGPGASSRNK
jgi:hypothetical protein